MKKSFVGIIGTAISSMGLAISTEQLEQIISIICSITGVIIVIVSSIIIPLIQWFKRVKADGKISKEELEEGQKIISNGVEDIKDSLDKKDK